MYNVREITKTRLGLWRSANKPPYMIAFFIMLLSKLLEGGHSNLPARRRIYVYLMSIAKF